ncbi:hypothetical protein GE118_03465 [Mycoplasma sp. NEAQ87857]|uniref:MAG3090 family protein n=1 Tax=Mycoplasma sp. NEAQ87857 TaxID=2683967 RepID=UPI001317103C|nr:hypothetical protein [Mycoplasma sp. NEAQ87857]QGZ97843.1 hypothetical protein GE118_03465 [Mycoplasma sp. NEAQ87857]
MKRLQCLYKPNKDENYPWALKHPKVNAPLALFKTRKDAMNWFLSLGYDCATWFQTDKKIWGGLLISEKEPTTGEFEYELNVDKFDGGLDYKETLKELCIHTEGLRNLNEAKKALEEVVDFKVLADHETYFPADEDLKIERKKSAKDEEIERLLSLLNESDADKELLQRKLELLQARQASEKQSKPEVVKEVKTVVEKSKPEIKLVKYEFINNLSEEEQIKSLALYAKKVEKLVAQLETKQETYAQDLEEIKVSLRFTLSKIRFLDKDFNGDADFKKLLKLVHNSLNNSIEKISELVVVNPELEAIPSKALYVRNCCGENLRFSELASYVVLDEYHVGFVELNEYKYAIFAQEAKKSSKFLVFDWPVQNNEVVTNVVVPVQETVIVEEEVEVEPKEETEEEKEEDLLEEATARRFNYWGIFLLAMGYGILITVIILQALNII